MTKPNRIYEMMWIDSGQILTPHEHYQREINTNRVKRIAKNFYERIANEPKVSFRDGKYYVFDGQHTIAARKLMNGNKNLSILCKVYMGMTEKEEAELFSRQTGESAPLTAGIRLRAEIFGEDEVALAFRTANADLGIELDYDQKRGFMRIGCIQTAYEAYRKLGTDRYKEAMKIIIEAWGGTRSVLLILNNTGNRYSSTLIVAPITSRFWKKETQPTHCLLNGLRFLRGPSAVLTEQIVTIDKDSVIKFLGRVSDRQLCEVDQAIQISLGLAV